VDVHAAYAVRSFREDDADACVKLYRDGLLGGQIASNDTGLDIDDIRGAYLDPPQNHFWVAEVTSDGEALADACAGTIVGMIGVQHHDEGVGEVRRLRVATEHRRRRVGSRLLEEAIAFCRRTGCLKVHLDTFIEREAAIKLFDRHRFRHGNTRQINGRDMMYFYLDFYTQPGE
jgi:ribosomal protein S18 acetylase RimI-like enzyme